MAGNTNGNILGCKPVLGSKPDSYTNDTAIALLKRLQNQSGLGGFDFGFSSGIDIFNEKSSDKIGYFEDLVSVPYAEGVNSLLAFAHTAYYHTHGSSFVYPDHGDNVVLTAGAGAWNLTGAITEVIPINTINQYDFDLHWINISAISANGEIQIDIYKGESGSETLLGSTRSHRNAVQSQENSKMIIIPQQAKNERISCRLSDSTAGQLTCAVSFEGHYYGVIGISPVT